MSSSLGNLLVLVLTIHLHSCHNHNHGIGRPDLDPGDRDLVDFKFRRIKRSNHPSDESDLDMADNSDPAVLIDALDQGGQEGSSETGNPSQPNDDPDDKPTEALTDKQEIISSHSTPQSLDDVARIESDHILRLVEDNATDPDQVSHMRTNPNAEPTTSDANSDHSHVHHPAMDTNDDTSDESHDSLDFPDGDAHSEYHSLDKDNHIDENDDDDNEDNDQHDENDHIHDDHGQDQPNEPTTASVISRLAMHKLLLKYGDGESISLEGLESLLVSLRLGNIALEDHSVNEHLTQPESFQDMHNDHSHSVFKSHDHDGSHDLAGSDDQAMSHDHNGTHNHNHSTERIVRDSEGEDSKPRKRDRQRQNRKKSNHQTSIDSRSAARKPRKKNHRKKKNQRTSIESDVREERYAEDSVHSSSSSMTESAVDMRRRSLPDDDALLDTVIMF